MILFLLWYLAVGYFIDRWQECRNTFDGLTDQQVVIVRALFQFAWPAYVVLFVAVLLVGFLSKTFSRGEENSHNSSGRIH
jgi:hypothetical protein